ncbi:MAG: aminodeoxychorismate synthase component I [Dehalococcoidia bacterium]|nr:aminodeoxychorismate synthase component I [Dehalococcoidia bacterium]
MSAAELFGHFQHEPFAFFLDSGMDKAKLGRYSFIGFDPFLVLKSRGDELTLLSPECQKRRKGNPFRALRELVDTHTLNSAGGPTPLPSGAVGYLSYDLCHFIENVPGKATDDLQLPECCLGFYDVVVTFDHLEERTYIGSSGFPEKDEGRRLKRASERLRQAKSRIAHVKLEPVVWHVRPLDNGRETAPISNFTRGAYLRAVEKAREYIMDGEIYQVNLSQRFETNLSGHPYDLYRRLRTINPAPFAAYLSLDELTILSASPERFLKVEGDRVETRPMKGTRPRGRSAAEDAALASELQNSVKDRAENVMIVDLERNDLGKVCRTGTVKVSELCTLERYPTVFQLTSCVEGRLAPGKDRIDLLEACFPGGSITGAPKIRAMEIIDELEPTRRGVYTGSIGYLSFSGEMDLSIVIRTIVAKNKRVYLQVGGGIVYDSKPEDEYQETLHKARGLFEALNLSPEVAAEV